MLRSILHCDMNNFYASVECMLDPALKKYPIAVCGSVEERHGIVLAKNYKATIGIVLCSDTDDDIARYSVMHGNEQLFASKYKLYLPTKEELKAEIETQKAMFYLQQQESEDKEIE